MAGTNSDLRELDTHFAFGENWADYARGIDDEAICRAEEGLLHLFNESDLKGVRFLDIGSGSGLHSLAALRLGAAEVLAVDIDPSSVKTTGEVLARHAPGTKHTVRQLSIFDADAASLGRFDVVYSWGVLHHTGDMWTAVEKAAELVTPGGLLAIALYQETPACGFWKKEKRFYTAAPELLRLPMRVVYAALFSIGMLANRKNPFRYISSYKRVRGMSYWHDVHDWLGGYPYESAAPDEVVKRLSSQGFQPVRLLPLPSGRGTFGTGCAEYVLRRDIPTNLSGTA